MKKGSSQLLDLAILSLLKRGELHGYQIRKSLAEMAGPLFQFSYGSLYPALARLEERGAVVSSTALFPNYISSTGSLSGDLATGSQWEHRGAIATGYDRSLRTKRTYTLTDLGEKLFDQLFENTQTVSETDFMAWIYLAEEKKFALVLERAKERLAKLESAKRRTFGLLLNDSVSLALPRRETHRRLADIYEAEIAFIKGLIEKLSGIVSP